MKIYNLPLRKIEKNPLPLSSLDDVLLSLDSFEELKKQITRKKKLKTKNKETKIEQLDIDYISNWYYSYKLTIRKA